MRRAAERLPGVRRIARPLPDGRTFDLSYVRTGPRGGPTVLVVPGGPGLASVLPYAVVRAIAAAKGLDVVMVEHRGVGLSRCDRDGADLPPEVLTIEDVVADLVAVLDAEGVDRVVAYGSSYGTYLVQGLGVRHPGRIAGMVLDSPMRSARDLDVVRRHLRSLLWDGTVHTAACAARLRELVADGVVDARETGAVVPVVYEAGGVDVLERLLGALARGRGRTTWDWVQSVGGAEADGPGSAYTLETDLVGRIAYAELDYGAPPDGLPLDPQVQLVDGARRHPAFVREPYDLVAASAKFEWPTAVVSGARDLRTPRPVAEALVADLPDGVLVPLPTTGHSILDTHALAAVHVVGAVATGHHDRLPRLADRIDALPRRGNGSHWLGRVLRARLAVDLVFGRRTG
ncbi:alpha/beta fold hydrolase [Pseudonocardia sp. CA-107938]|uniref:alpha/beta fold hydrolase n=1 Tax=Pseudonocardia sp. CA-107938 TaxID=3240021 RepID=UPI003D9020EB